MTAIDTWSSADDEPKPDREAEIVDWIDMAADALGSARGHIDSALHATKGNSYRTEELKDLSGAIEILRKVACGLI